MSHPPKFLLFVVNPVRREVVLVNHRFAAAGSNQWNGILCPSASDMADDAPSAMIVFEMFCLTQQVYSPTDWSVVGNVGYENGKWNCQILVSLTCDTSFINNAGGMDSQLRVVNAQQLTELEKAKALAPYVKTIVEHIFRDLDAIGPIEAIHVE
jgi:hypothetical protein